MVVEQLPSPAAAQPERMCRLLQTAAPPDAVADEINALEESLRTDDVTFVSKMFAHN
ncbi:hypothetical protein T484DRAFT_1778694 [Baffinella frigidus]|nr:hypothetical protein T484DRAFT_1778694 [Cryptophyta sp. CCMP2293]